MNIAAIDIGSNACRLLINEVKKYDDHTIDFIKVNLIRVPLRLGIDVFKTGMISEEKYQMYLSTMHAYAHLMKAYNVLKYKAYATSAMRDASNGKEIIKKIKAETGINIEIIDGIKEAELFQTQNDFLKSNAKTQTLLVDVGGGSTEITSFLGDTVTHQRSFNIGTLRILNNNVTKENWNELKVFVKKILNKKYTCKIIATGGNINKVFSMSKLKDGSALKYATLEKMYIDLSKLSVKERMHIYKLKEDRADVIVPALQIFLCILNATQIQQIHVPKIGIADGIIREIYRTLQ